MNSEWGTFAKLCYRLFLRKLIKKAVDSTSNEFDNWALAQLDKMAGYVDPDLAEVKSVTDKATDMISKLDSVLDKK